MNVLLYACHCSIKESNCNYGIQGYGGTGGIKPITERMTYRLLCFVYTLLCS